MLNIPKLASALKPLIVEVNHIDHLITVQYSAGEHPHDS